MTPDHLQALLSDLGRVSVGVIGDFCLDIYWMVDLAASEPSLETGRVTHPVRTQRYSLGGAGNVVNNLVALGVGKVQAFGVLGDDPWGRELRRLLGELRVETSGLQQQVGDWDTLAYTKPHLGEEEQNRLDFGNFNRLSTATAEALLGALETALAKLDVVVVNEQVRQGIHSDYLRPRLAALMARHPMRLFVVDSRHYSEGYPAACLKLNGHEALRLAGVSRPPEALVMRQETVDAAEAWFARHGKPVFVTRGARGVVVRDATGLSEIPGLQILGRTDPVGAGDSMLAGLAAGLAAGRSPAEAATLGNFVAGVTVRKLRQTGTATPAEIRAVGLVPDYVFRPELAEDPRQARYHAGTDLEIVTRLPAPGSRLQHVIFDHDGTLSTLREGWEAIMEPMMVQAILGPQFAAANESLYHQVVDQVRHFIDQTTGVQTLSQMAGLVKLVRDFGCVPVGEVLDAAGYKAIYNKALLIMVNRRVARLAAGELSVADVVVKNAPLLLERLHAAGVRLYLASGTDQEDVEKEARALGYAHCFTGGIYGAGADATHEAKRVVLDRILREIGPGGLSGLATFGDGPVEIRETQRRGGLAIGVASDEVRRFGLHPGKRARLIRAGADLILPDYAQIDQWLSLLGVP